MPTLDFASVVRLLLPLLSSVAAGLPATTSPFVKVLINLALQVLGQFASQAGIAVGDHNPHLFGAYLPRELPSEDQWTPEGLKAFAETHAAAVAS